MASIRTRLLFATLLSAGGFAATLQYYRSTEPAQTHATERLPLAFAKNVDGHHQEKREGSTLWSNLQEGDPLYVGDTIRTADRGSLKIQFTKSSQLLELDSDTTLILAQSGQAIVVDLLTGYVKSQGAANQANELKVKTSDGFKTIDSNSVLMKDEKASLQLSDSRTTIRPVNSQGVTWSSPMGDTNAELNPDEPAPQKFTWTGGTASQKIAIEWGPTRKQMDHRKVVDATLRTADYVLPIGRHYWRWSVVNSSDETKAIYTAPASQIVVKGVFPPAVTAPTAGQVILFKSLGESVDLKWALQKRFDHYRVEVATQKTFAPPTILQSKELVEGEERFTPVKFGEYFWRVSGHVAATNGSVNDKWLRSRAFSFKTLAKLKERVNLKWTSRSGRIDYVGNVPSIDLTWEADAKANIKDYRLRIADSVSGLSSTPARVLTASKFHAGFQVPGAHFAVVQAISADLEIIGQTPVLSFEMQPVPLLRAPAFVSNDALTANARGQLEVSWKPLEGAKEYVVELRDSLGKSISRQTTAPAYLFSKLLPGRYELKVLAVDQYGRSGAISPTRSITVSNKSALKAIKIKKVDVR